jgi:hypothetical protein
MANWGFDLRRNPQQSLNGDDFLSALDFSKVFGVQVSQFRQSLLGKPGFLAMQTYSVTDKFSVRVQDKCV